MLPSPGISDGRLRRCCITVPGGSDGLKVIVVALISSPEQSQKGEF